MAYQSPVWNFQCGINFNPILRLFNLVILINNVSTILVHFVKMLPKCDIYKYSMWGQALGLRFACCRYSYSLMISSLYFWNVKSDDGCLVQLKHIAFYITITSVEYWRIVLLLHIINITTKKSAGETAITHADIYRNQSSVILYINTK
jgi:hypothetical protein